MSVFALSYDGRPMNRAFFCCPLLCRAARILARSFLFYCTSSRVEKIPRACAGPMTDSLIQPHPVRPLRPVISYLPYSLRLCQYLRQPRFLIARFSAALFPCRTSCLRVCCLLRKRFSMSSSVFRLSVRFFHTISLIHRHLALYHSQVAILNLHPRFNLVFVRQL